MKTTVTLLLILFSGSFLFGGVSGPTLVCPGSSYTYVLSPAGFGNYSWSVNGVNKRLINSPNVTIDIPESGATVFVITVRYTPASGPQQTYSVTSNVYSAGSVSADVFNVCSGQPVNIFHNGYSSATVWQRAGADGSWTDLSWPNEASLTDKPVATSYYRARLNQCGNLFSNTVKVNVYESPVGGISSASSETVCSSGIISLSLAGHVGTVSNWEVRSKEDSGVFGKWDSFSSNSYPVSCVSSWTGRTYQFRARITNGSCTSVMSSITTVAVYPPTIPGEIFSDQLSEVYGTTSATMTLTGAVGNIVSWQYLKDNIVSEIANTSSVYSFSNLNATTSFRAAVQNSSACKVEYSPWLTITVFPVPEIIVEGPRHIAIGSRTVLKTYAVCYDYEWLKEGNTFGEKNTSVVITSPGNYSLRIRQTSGSPVFTTKSIFIGEAVASQPPINFISVKTFLKEGIADNTDLFILSPGDISQQVQYMDGLGRLIQSCDIGASPAGNDVIHPIQYDLFGRSPIQYLPYASNGRSGQYSENALRKKTYKQGEQYQFYQNSELIPHDTVPFGSIVFEPSPMKRQVKQFGAGGDWRVNDKYIEKQFLTNLAVQEKIIAWKVSSDGMPLRRKPVAGIVLSGGYYASGQLSVLSTKDEEGREVREYTNKKGQVILKKVQYVNSPILKNRDHWAQTYYLYDNTGNLRFVLTPELTRHICQSDEYVPDITDLNNWAFQYSYDARNRMISKRLPGTDPVYMVYDYRDRLVLTQDGNQRTKKQWLFTKYDTLNRPVITGIYTHGDTVNQRNMASLISNSRFCEYFNGELTTHGYTNTVWPTNNLDVLTVTYYDNYYFRSQSNGLDYVYSDLSSLPTEFSRATGLMTGTKIRVLGTSNYLYNVNYYDEKERIVQIIAGNLVGGFDRHSNTYDFAGKVVATRDIHTDDSGINGFNENCVKRTFLYDHAGRLLRTWHKFNLEDSVLLAENEYNEMGQLIDKKLHSTDNGNIFKQSIDHRYNIRGWLTSINNSQLTNDGLKNNDTGDLFGMELSYNNSIDMTNAALFDGSISAVKWSRELALGTVKDVGYHYSYDPLNRILSAIYLKDTTGGWANPSGAFSESGYKYDYNGNIISLERRGYKGNLMDRLTYDYGMDKSRSNRLLSVTDSGETANGFKDDNSSDYDYSYDLNGNMIADRNKGIDRIEYNHLNLPERIVKNTGDYLVYRYDAKGKKLSQEIYNSVNQLQNLAEYSGEYFYENDTLKFINHEEGRLVMADTSYQYHLKDHLGNIRVTFTTRNETETAIATHESIKQLSESGQYQRYAETRRIYSALLDRTGGISPGYVQRLSGSVNEKYGLARSLSVMPGDTVKVEVYAKYIDPNSSNWTEALSILAGQITGNAPGVVVDGLAYHSSTLSFPASMLGHQSTTDNGAPKAYLNWLIFDREYHYLDGGFKQITAAARETGTDTPHERIAPNEDLLIRQAGYIYIYLSNEETSPVEVFFDDFKVEHIKSSVVQTDDYYPYGLNFNSYRREHSPVNKYLYNGKELQDGLGMGWLDFGRRMYMPEIGRFMTQDRFVEKFFALTPYQFAADNPVLFIDINGDSIISILRQGQNINIVNSPLKEGGENFTNSIILDSGVSGDDVSDFSAGIVNDAMIAIGDNEIGISSGSRTPEEQAAVMYNNLENGTVAGEKETYGNSGDAVIDSYVEAKGEKPPLDATAIKQKMIDKINEKGPENVSDHTVGDNSKVNVFDIKPSTVSDPTKFHNTLAGDARVTTGGKVLSKVNKPSEKAIHLKIKQNQ